MLTETTTQPRARGLADLPAVQTDSLLQLIAMCNADPRQHKIDVGVGVYRDSVGRTPVLQVIKDAEAILLKTQESKGYLGMTGDKRYTELLRPIVLGRHADDERIAGVQTPGGCGALCLGFDLVARANPDARVLIGGPTWPNHPPIVRSVGLEIVDYPYYARGQATIRFEDMMEALGNGRSGDIALLHGCCHNPTGADLDDEQWAKVSEVVADRGLIPFVDLAYQGFGRGLEQDASGLWRLLDVCDEVLVSQSCDKNFAVYRDRVGNLFVKTGSKESTATAMAHVMQSAREKWSMPPDHGAAAVRIVLDTPELADRWHVELAGMRDRINSVRQRIASADPRLSFIGRQFGMFSMLPLSKEQVVELREKYAIYMAESGRFNVVGLSDEQVDPFVEAVLQVMNG